MKTLYYIGKWQGIPIKTHWSVLCLLILFWLVSWHSPQLFVGFLAYIVLLLTHEFGHAMMARWRKIDVNGIYLYLFHGWCEYDASDYEEDNIWIAWGGVAGQSVLLLPGLTASLLQQSTPAAIALMLEPITSVFVVINILTIIFNLLPIKPLDGHLAWRFLGNILQEYSAQNIIPSRWLRRRQLSVKASREEAERIADDAIKKMMDTNRSGQG